MYTLYNMDEPMPSVEEFSNYRKNEMIPTLESDGVNYTDVGSFVGKSVNNWRGVTKEDCIAYFSHYYGQQAAAPASPHAGWAPPSRPPSPPFSLHDPVGSALQSSAQAAYDAVGDVPVFEAPEIPSVKDLKKMTVANLKKLAAENGITPPEDGWGRKAEIVAYIHSMRGAVGAPAPSAPPMVNAEDLFGMGPADWQGAGGISGDANGAIPAPNEEIHIEQNDTPTTELSRLYNVHGGGHLETAWQSLRTGLAQSLNMYLDREQAQQARLAREARRTATTFNQGGTDFLRTELYSFLLLSGRRRRDGVSVQNIQPGRGPVIRTDRGWPTDHQIRTPHGFTTFIVNRTDFSLEQHQGFVLSTDLSNTLSPPSRAPARSFIRENYREINLGSDGAAAATTLRIIQLPMSVEIAGDGSAPVPICNLLFFMNPNEMERLLEDGVFHQLEYYANAYDNPSLRQSYNTLVQAEGGNVTVLRKISLFSRALADWFTGTYGFSSEARSANGQPDALYIYKQWIHHVRTVQKHYNKFVTLLNKLQTTDSPSQELRNLVDSSYQILVNIIYEMDVWNYIVQTPLPGVDPASPGHWNFSALGISRIPNIGETQAIEGNGDTIEQLFPGNTFRLDERLASYKLGTKPPIEYPRWMLQIFTTIEEYLLTTGVSVRDSMRAINDATAILQAQRLTIPESIAFGNLMILYRQYQPGSPGIPNTPEERLRLLFPTRAGPNLTVEAAHRSQTAADARLLTFIREAASMTEQQYIAETNQPRSAIRLASADVRSTNPNSITQYFNVGDTVELPDREFRDVAESGAASSVKKRRVTLSSNVANRTIQITGVHVSMTGDIFYDYREQQGAGVIEGRISQLDLLLSEKNVSKATERQTDARIQQQLASAARQGESERQVACASANVERTNYSQLENDDDRYERHLLALAQARGRENPEEKEDPNLATVITSENATPNQKADGVILMMAREMRASRAEMLRQQRILRAAAQNDALVGQQAVEGASLSEYDKKVIYFEYKMYCEKWRSLKTQWYSMRRLKERGAGRPEIRSNGDKEPLEDWNSQTGRNITIVRRRLMSSIFDRTIGCLSGSIFRPLVQRARRVLTESSETLADTWNNGRLRTFEEWRIRTYPQDPMGGTPYNQLNQAWYDEQLARENQFNTWIREDQAQIEAAQQVVVEADADAEGSSSGAAKKSDDAPMFGGAKIEQKDETVDDPSSDEISDVGSIGMSKNDFNTYFDISNTEVERKSDSSGGKKRKKTRRRKNKKANTKRKNGGKRKKKSRKKRKKTHKRY